jgi:(1->4)-alpha-D-glucan 1-alpha-D-glucosylmutase
VTRPLGSTYRLQLNGLGFGRARSVVGYLHRLGVETLYVSPVLAARPGSTHGYDVVDPTRLDPELGTPEEWEALLAELDNHRMRLLIDTVPNHLAVSSSNPWWWETLRRGRDADHAGVFDIDWSAHGGRVLLPVLGKPLGQVLAEGELSVVEEGTEPELAYFDTRFPLDPATVGDGPLPGGLGDGADGAALAELVERQHYRLAHWRLGRRQGNYRRFFDVDGLVGVRVEDPEVYRATHRLILELVADRRVAGLRLDHVDGLADPAGYLDRLRADVERVRSAGAAGDRDQADDHRGAALVVEKIVARSECLPTGWPVDGMTGYEFADLVGGLWVEPSAGDAGFAALAVEAKREVMVTLFPGQVDRVARLATDAAQATIPGVDLDPADVAEAVRALTAHLQVYRTYLGVGPPSDADRRRLGRAATLAGDDLDAEGRRALGLLVEGLYLSATDPAWGEVTRRWQQLTGAVAAKGVEDTALYRTTGTLAAAEVGGDPGQPAVEVDAFHWAMEGRAVTSPGALNATSSHDTKRSEDVRARLAALTEWAPWEEQLRSWEARHCQLVGPDRLPDRHDQRFLSTTAVGAWPAPGAERAELPGRLRAYLVKAAREAKRQTSWLEPNPGYEERLESLVDRLFSSDGAGFREEVEAVVEAVGPAGAVNGLSATVLKMTAPGVPDVYQSTETWSYALVDPDNRRPVDFARLEAQLAELAGSAVPPAHLLSGWRDGRVKVELTRRLLAFRRANPELFAGGEYLPLSVSGPQATHVVAFARRQGEAWSISVVPRLVLSLAGSGRFPVGPDLWAGTTVQLPAGAPTRLVDVVTDAPTAAPGGVLGLDAALAEFPVAALVGA